MDIDIYKACPCQSGKKIKFCCSKDILLELKEVLSLHHGKQFVAALEKLTRLRDKHGPRACLLGLQTHILIHLKEYEQARQVNNGFLQANPRNPLGYQHEALLLAAEGRAADAVEALQNGLDACPQQQVPVTMANAFRTVGMLLMSQGQVVAGRAHLVFAAELREGDNEVASQLILQSLRSGDIPLILKSEFPITLPKNSQEPWLDKFLNALRFSSIGRWRAARLLMDQLNDAFPRQPAIWQAIAVWSMYLADAARAEEAFRQYSDLEAVDFDDAVDALATAMVIDDAPITDAFDFVQITYSVDNLTTVSEMALACPNIVSGTIYSQAFIDPEAPPPQAAFLLLDSDEIKHAGETLPEKFPVVIGEMLLYGRQTNRDPRLEFFTVRDGSVDETLSALHKALGDGLLEKANEQVVEQISVLDHELNVKWHLPEDMSIDRRRDFVRQQRHREFMEVLPGVPFHSLQGRNLREAAGDPGLLKNAAAIVLMIEQGADSLSTDVFDFDQLREQLNLPVPQSVDLETRHFDELSPVQMQRVDFARVSDELLIKAYVLASSCGNLRVLRATGPIILQRPEMEKMIRFELIYVVMARLTPDTDQALELMQKARKHALAADRSIGGLLIDELELRLERNRPDGCQELLRVLQAHHLKDPQNQYRLAAVLQRFGIMGADGRMRSDAGEADEPVAAAAAVGELWTPGEAGPAETESEGKSGLWLPD